MFRLLKNGDVYAPEHIGKADILICNDKIVDIASISTSIIPAPKCGPRGP